MATVALGKLKFNLSGQGLAYRWGDGEIHRLFQGKNRQADDDDYLNDAQAGGDAYQDDYDSPEGDYDAGYDDDPDYADDDYDDDRYADDGYDDDRYADDYDDDGYADDGYEGGRYADEDDYDGDRYADDGYDSDGYDDDGRYDDDDGDYDDRYQDEDADDAYGDDGEYYSERSALMRYVDENDWVTYVLLFLLPPLGIYLLWRRGRFDKPVRWAVTAVSAIWFVVALFLLLRGLIGGVGDRQAQPDITLPPETVEETVAPTAEPAAAEDITSIDLGGGALAGAEDETAGADTEEETPTDSADAQSDGEAPAPTALAAANGGSTADTANYVWSPASGLYYHSVQDCPRIEEGVQVWRVTREIAENSRHQSPCPDCIGGGTTVTYYGTVGGKYYHSDASCSSMRNPMVYTKQAAENEGKTPCPVCILKTQTSLDETEDVNTALINKDTNDASGIEVYATKNGSYFHVKSDCSGMQDAVKGPLKEALLAGKKACPTCCPQAGELVYCTSGGKSYHVDRNCQGMTGAKHVTLAEAMVLGKTKCDVCITGSVAGATADAGATGGLPTNVTGDDVKVFATQNGTYYHTNSTCSGMKDAQQYTLKSMLLAGKKACPVCASGAETQVYATKGGKYYHSYATCSGMTDAKSGTLAEALAAGYKRCPNCWGSSASATKSGASASAATASEKASASAATAARATAAPSAQSASSNKVQAAASRATASNTYVYATQSGSYYHLNSSCGGMTGASRITLKTAVKAGKKACPICATAANRTVYSTSNGDHYHVASVCAPSGMKNGTKRTLSEALLLNQTACPYCLGSRKAAVAAVEAANEAASAAKAQAAANAAATAAAKAQAQAAAAAAAKAQAAAAQRSTYSSGKSGVRVYATVSGKYYHTTSSCSNISGTPSRVTLETALNYGKQACPVCAGSATRTVYATRGGKYYHYSKADAGAGAKQGTLASALAYGFDPCPNCVTRTAARQSEEGAAQTAAYQSGTSGIKVYATLGSKYYHAKSDCSGLTGASRISLETALNYGKKACPVCLAPASKKVYAAPGDKYYHFSKSHAGAGATAGTLAQARALGLKACPDCTVLSAGAENYDNGGAENAPVSTEQYAAAAGSSVYIDIGSANSYYHKAAKCSHASFSGGTKVTLQYAVDWGYKACPYCNPPTNVAPEKTSEPQAEPTPAPTEAPEDLVPASMGN